jgi:hypothetical protein
MTTSVGDFNPTPGKIAGKKTQRHDYIVVKRLGL